MVNPPVGLPKRGPKRPTAAQQGFLAKQNPNTVTPAPQPGQPNQFSASGQSGQSASTGMGQSASGASSIPSPSLPGAAASPTSMGMVPSASGQMKRGGTVNKYAAGGTTETNQAGSWGGANATNAIDQASTPQTGGVGGGGGGYNYTPGGGGAGPFSTTPQQSPLGSSNFTPAATPSAGATSTQATMLPTIASGTYTVNPNGSTSGGLFGGSGLGYLPNGAQYTPDYQPGTSPSGQPIGGGGPNYVPSNGPNISGSSPSSGQYTPDYPISTAAQGGSIEAPKEEPYRNKWKAKNHPGDSSYKFDDGGEVDPNALLGDQQQQSPVSDNPQATDTSTALQAVMGAYQYGMQQLAGNIPAVPAGPGGAGPNPNPFPTKTPQVPFGKMAQDQGSDYTIAGARGGSVPSFDMGGGVPMPPPATPQPQQPAPTPAGGGVQGQAPPNIMRYLTGADAAPVPQVLQKHRMLQHLPPTARTIHNIASAGGPQQQYQTLQAYRKLADAAGVHARVALQGNGKLPPSLPHAIAFANKKFEYTPSPIQLQFSLKGKGKPTQNTAMGGGIQAFDDGGAVQGADAAPDTNDPTQQLAAAGAQQPNYGPLSYDQRQLQAAGTPVTVTATDLTNGHEISGDIPQSAMGELVGNTVDNLITRPVNSVVDKIKDKISNVIEAGNPFQTDVTNPGKETDQPYDLVDAIKNGLSALGGDTSLAGTTIRPPTGTKNAVAFPGPSPEGRGAAQQDTNAPTPQPPAQQPSSQRGLMSKLAQVGGSLATAGAIPLPGFAGAARSQAPSAPQVPQPGGASPTQTTPGTTDANQYNAGIRPLSGGGVQSQALPQMTAQSGGGGNPNLGNHIIMNPMTGQPEVVPVGQDLSQAGQGGSSGAPQNIGQGNRLPAGTSSAPNQKMYDDFAAHAPGPPQNAGQGSTTPQAWATDPSTAIPQMIKRGVIHANPSGGGLMINGADIPGAGRGRDGLVVVHDPNTYSKFMNTLEKMNDGKPIAIQHDADTPRIPGPGVSQPPPDLNARPTLVSGRETSNAAQDALNQRIQAAQDKYLNSLQPSIENGRMVVNPQRGGGGGGGGGAPANPNENDTAYARAEKLGGQYRPPAAQRAIQRSQQRSPQRTPGPQSQAQPANDYVRVGQLGTQVHQADIARLKQNPAMAQIFDTTYGQPGLAQQILGA